MRKLIAGAALALIVSGVGGTAFAGEITGGKNPKPTPIDNFGHAQSICAFSGQNDVPEGDIDHETGELDPLSVGKVQNWGHTQALAKALFPPEVFAAARAENMPGATCNGHTGIIAQVFGGG